MKGKIIFLAALLFFAALAVPFLSFAAESEFARVNGGAFDMGSPRGEYLREKDEAQHKVTVSPFMISRKEMTNSEYRTLTGKTPSEFKDGAAPAENVSWYDAVACCNARSKKEGLKPAYIIKGRDVTWDRKANGYRLPTEAEWEFAARAGTKGPFSTGDAISQTEANYYGHYPYGIERSYFTPENMKVKPGRYNGKTLPAGSFKPNRLGLYDMHGNVGEWCWDRYGAYPKEAAKDPAGAASGNFRVTRGGGWNDFARHLRSAAREPFPPEIGSYNIGIRLVRNAQ